MRDDHDTDGHAQGRAESVRVLALRSSVIHGFVTEPRHSRHQARIKNSEVPGHNVLLDIVSPPPPHTHTHTPTRACNKVRKKEGSGQGWLVKTRVIY